MKKIISLFQRNYDGDHLVRDEVVPGAEWVLAGEGVATRKYDGTCCMVCDGRLYKRYDAKTFTVNHATGERHAWDRKPPEGFEPAQEPDENTGHWPGWVPVSDKPEDAWHREAFENHKLNEFPDGTYELCGPKVSANPELFEEHRLIPHGKCQYDDCPRTFDGLRLWFEWHDIEGIVFHHPDGRMVKIKKRDFGLLRK